MSEERRRRWGTRSGFYFASVGTAFGLGNIWRFPFVVAENGGGVFVLIYLALVFLVGVPFLIGELLLGKSTGMAVAQAMRQLSQKHEEGKTTRRADPRLVVGTGYLAMTLCLLVLAYYAVISGWVLHFLLRFMASLAPASSFDPSVSLDSLIGSGWLQILLTSVHLAIVMIAVAKDVEVGVERWVGKVMPLFLGLVIIVALRSFSMDTASEALRFFLYPNFSKLTFDTLGRALGQVCFTLSIGFGTMVSFGSFMSDRVNAPITGFQLVIFDTLVSFFAGIMVFPLVFSREVVAPGPLLLFETVPFLFARLPLGELFGAGFFLCLYLAALGASIGLLETIVGNLRELKGIARWPAALMTVAACLIVAIVPAMSSNVLKDYRINGQGVLEAWDGTLINWALPVVALIISQVVIRRLDRDIQRNEFDSIPSAAMGRLYAHWRFTIRYLAPAICVLALVLQLF